MWMLLSCNLYELAQICNQTWNSYPKINVFPRLEKRMAVSRGILTLPFRTIPEKGLCEQLAAMLVTEPGTSVFSVRLQ